MSVNTTVSHISPVLAYVPGMIWYEGTTEDESLVSNPEIGVEPISHICIRTQAGYWGDGYHATNSSQGEGRVLFQWFGTGKFTVTSPATTTNTHIHTFGLRCLVNTGPGVIVCR